MKKNVLRKDIFLFMQYTELNCEIYCINNIQLEYSI